MRERHKEIIRTVGYSRGKGGWFHVPTKMFWEFDYSDKEYDRHRDFDFSLLTFRGLRNGGMMVRLTTKGRKVFEEIRYVEV